LLCFVRYVSLRLDSDLDSSFSRMEVVNCIKASEKKHHSPDILRKFSL
jgi:hypothetical protein